MEFFLKINVQVETGRCEIYCIRMSSALARRQTSIETLCESIFTRIPAMVSILTAKSWLLVV
jgi:hypothetical protein